MKNLLFCLLCLYGATQLSAQTTPATAPAPQPDYKEYGGKLTIGFSIFDGLGIPVRYYAGSNVLEGGFYMGSILFINDNELDKIAVEPMLGAGYTYFGNRYLKTKKKHNRIRTNGICLRANQLLGDYPVTTPSLSWAQESFLEGRTNRSLLFELGIQYALPNYIYQGEAAKNQVGIRLRLQWNFFLK